MPTETRWKQPIRGETSIEVAARPEALYDYVTDVTNMGRWSPECTGGRWLHGATGPEPGARFKGRNKNRFAWSTASTVVAADRGRDFTFVRDRPRAFGAVRWRYVFDPLPGGTRVTESFEQVGTAGRWALVMAELVTGVKWNEREALNVTNMRTTLAQLKSTAEAKTAPNAPEDRR